MSVAYWILAGLLATFYLYSGGIKIARPVEKLRPRMQWVVDVPVVAIRAIGVVEVLGAIGLIAPPLLGVVPGLACAAAIGLVSVQVAAAVVHLRRKDTIWMNLTLIVVAGTVAWLATIWL